MNNIIKGIICFITVIVLSVVVSGESHAVGNYYYNGLQSPNDSNALKKAKQINNKDVTIQRYNYANKTKYKAVGRIRNNDGWKGYGKDSMGTGFVIDDYTVLTNAHVIDRSNGHSASPKDIVFHMNRDGRKIPYTFHASKIIKVPSSDIAIIHTKEKMSKYTQPLNLASESQIKNLKFKDNLYSLGYPWQFNGTRDDNTLAYRNKLKFLQFSSNKTEIQTKDKFRSGASGSPMVNGNYHVYGLRTYGYNLRGGSTDSYAKQEVAGGEALVGYARNYVLSHSK